MGQSCQGGLCNDPCKGDPKAKTNVGCDYYAVDLDNAYVFSGTANDDGTPKYLDAQHAQFSVIVSNTSAATATVTVTSGTYKSSYSVAAGALKILNLPDPTWKACTAGKSCPFDQEGTNVNTATYRIKSTQPIVAYQFNPLEYQAPGSLSTDMGRTAYSFSNDASMLIPSGALTGTPKAAGSFALTVQVADASGQRVQKAFTLSIAAANNPAPTLTAIGSTSPVTRSVHAPAPASPASQSTVIESSCPADSISRWLRK